GVVAEVDPNCPMKAAACQLVLNVLERIGEVIATHPEALATSPASHIEAVLASDKPQDWITTRCHIPAVVAETTVTPWKLRQPSTEPPTTTPASASTSTGETTLRVEADRVDQVLNLIGELIIGRSMLQQVLSDFS